MVKINILNLCIYLCLAANLSGKLEKEVSISYRQERIEGKLFSIRIDIVDGKKSEKCAIDGKDVSFDEYESLILEAEKQIRKTERRQEQERVVQSSEFKNKIRIEAIIKLLNILVGNIEKSIKRFKDYDIEKFVPFSDSTISEEQFIKISKEFIPNAKSLIYKQDAPDLQQLQTTLDELEPFENKLELLFQATIKEAIDKSDDTKLLKRILSI